MEKIESLIEKAEGFIAELKDHIKASKPSESVRFKKLFDGWVFDKRTGLEWGPSSDKRMDFANADL